MKILSINDVDYDDSIEYSSHKQLVLRQYGQIPLQLVFRCPSESDLEIAKNFMSLLGYQEEIANLPKKVTSYSNGWRYYYIINKEVDPDCPNKERCGLFFYMDSQEEYDLIIKTFKNTFKNDTRTTRQTTTKST